MPCHQVRYLESFYHCASHPGTKATTISHLHNCFFPCTFNLPNLSFPFLFLTNQKQRTTYIHPQTKSLPHTTLSTTTHRQTESLLTRPIKVCRALLRNRRCMALINRRPRGLDIPRCRCRGFKHRRKR
jgi:hypothetical protein